jgi:hypothetical protein
LSTTIASPVAARPARRSSLGAVEGFGLGVLLLASFFPATSPTAAAFTDPTYSNIWSSRVYGPANAFELAMILFGIAWIVARGIEPARRSSFDRPLAVLALCLALVEVVALSGTFEDAIYLKPDLERIALLAAGYWIVTRCVRDRRLLRLFVLTLAGAIALRATQLVITYGLSGETQFATILGDPALLITADGLLLILPVSLAWGAVVDGRLSGWGRVGAVAGTVLALGINLVSLRRGALIMLSGTILARSLRVRRSRLLAGVGVALAIIGVTALAGPGRPLVSEVTYTIESSLLRTDDASTSQRSAELQNFGRNVDGVDWIVGRGLGVFWRAEVPSPIDSASFGSKETALYRIGWHVYGLDWLYKFGFLGVGLILTAMLLLGKRVLAAYRAGDSEARWLTYSLAVCAPVLLLMSLSGPRISLIAGIAVGLLSRCCDLAPRAARNREAG